MRLFFGVYQNVLVFIMCIRELLLHVSKITHIYFSFLLELDNIYFFILSW